MQRLAKLEPVAEEAARLRKEVGSLREMVQQRTQAAEAASRAVQAAAAERAKVEERLSVEAGRLQGGVSRLDADLTAARRRLAEVEAERNARAAELARAKAELERLHGEVTRLGATAEARQKAASVEAGGLEQRHQAEVARLKAAMVDLEKHLEVRARAEMVAKKRVQELEKAAAAPRGRRRPGRRRPAQGGTPEAQGRGGGAARRERFPERRGGPLRPEEQGPAGADRVAQGSVKDPSLDPPDGAS